MIHNNLKNIKKIICDIVLNLVAVAMPVALLQLFIYPQVAKYISGQEYGLMLTIYSVWIMIPNSVGNVFNNIKLLRFPEYQKHVIQGDFPVLISGWLSIVLIIVFLAIWFYYGSFTITHIITGTFIGFLFFLHAYLSVWFRIELNYLSVLINSICLSVGYLAGYIVFRMSGAWEWVFLLGYLFSCLFCVAKTPLLREPYQKTILYPAVKKDSVSLIIASVIGNLVNYADKLVLYPLMGGMAVSVYYTATILGKITGMLTGPINSVALSYIARWDKNKAGFFSKVIYAGLAICCLGYGLAILLARPVIGLLFPQWLEPVMEIIPLTTVTVMLGVLASILQPFVLKYCKLQWQTIISAVSSIVYFASALALWHYFGLKGFCVGTILGILVKLALMITVYFKNLADIDNY